MIQQGLAKQYVLDTPIEIEPSWNAKRVEDALRAGAKTPSEIAIESGVSLAMVKSMFVESRNKLSTPLVERPLQTAETATLSQTAF
jgi:hypothetical protein